MTFEDRIPGLSYDEPVEYKAIVHHEDGSYWVEIEALPGCFATGDSIEELTEALTEALSMYLSSKGITVNVHDLQLVSIDDHEHYRVLVGA